MIPQNMWHVEDCGWKILFLCVTTIAFQSAQTYYLCLAEHKTGGGKNP